MIGHCCFSCILYLHYFGIHNHISDFSATLAVNYLTLSSKSEIMECGVIVIWTSTYPHFWLVDIYLVITVLNFIFLLDKKIVPKTANDIKLISAGKILENNKTVGQCKVPFGELPKGTITMHVVVQPPLTKAKTGNFHVLCANIEQEPFHISIMSLWHEISQLHCYFFLCFCWKLQFLFVYLDREEAGWTTKEKFLLMFHIVIELVLI